MTTSTCQYGHRWSSVHPDTTANITQISKPTQKPYVNITTARSSHLIVMLLIECQMNLCKQNETPHSKVPTEKYLCTAKWTTTAHTNPPLESTFPFHPWKVIVNLDAKFKNAEFLDFRQKLAEQGQCGTPFKVGYIKSYYAFN